MGETVSIWMTIVGVLLIVATVAVCVWALRHQRRQFPRGAQTGWEPRGDPGWLVTKFTWLSGGRG